MLKKDSNNIIYKIELQHFMAIVNSENENPLKNEPKLITK
jgi:hypothetical protein